MRETGFVARDDLSRLCLGIGKRFVGALDGQGEIVGKAIMETDWAR